MPSYTFAYLAMHWTVYSSRVKYKLCRQCKCYVGKQSTCVSPQDLERDAFPSG